jgi:lipoic acid synthetase
MHPSRLVSIENAVAPGGRATRGRLPEWLRKATPHHESVTALKRDLRSLDLHTVCESARCPNMHECFHRGQATFMILGNICTRGCGFCSVPKGRAEALDPMEPAHVARQAAAMGLRYVVITSVNRDDLADGGSAHFAETVREVRRALPGATVEVLTPDFDGNLDAVASVLDAGPHVFNHNMETVRRLYSRVRPQADYRQSLEVLRFAKRHSPGVLAKSGLMVGLGESIDEVRELLADLRNEAEADVATIGQYLQPTRRNLPVLKYVTPAEFDFLREQGMALGFKMVFSGPFVRSSYMADIVAHQAHDGGRASE